jgi:alpha-D-ribose 1-methylphosphonate 5-phosphate C-P lyase
MGWISGKQQERDHKGLRDNCSACGHKGSGRDRLVKDDHGSRVHESHTTDRGSGLFGRRQ